jgi:hypothetical protein
MPIFEARCSVLERHVVLLSPAYRIRAGKRPHLAFTPMTTRHTTRPCKATKHGKKRRYILRENHWKAILQGGGGGERRGKVLTTIRAAYPGQHT